MRRAVVIVVGLASVGGGVVGGWACGGDGPTEVVRIDVDEPTAFATCDAFCGDQGYACADTCSVTESFAGTSTGAAEAGYLAPGDDQIFLSAYESCGDTIAPQDPMQPPLHELVCCCEIPAQTRIDSSIESPVSCAAACDAVGLSCNPNTYWPFPSRPDDFLSDVSASMVIRASGASTAINQYDCEHVPPILEGEWSLIEHSCGCK